MMLDMQPPRSRFERPSFINDYRPNEVRDDDLSHFHRPQHLSISVGGKESWPTPDVDTPATTGSENGESLGRGGQQQQQQPRNNSSRYKTELCRPFMETGSCRYGEKCQFAHGAAEQRAVERHPKYKTEACRTFYKDGFCPYGSRCHFVHEPKESRDDIRGSSSHGNLSDGSSDGGSNPGTPSSTRAPLQLLTPTTGASSPMTRSRPTTMIASARLSPPRSRQGRTPTSPPLPVRFPSQSGGRRPSLDAVCSVHGHGCNCMRTQTQAGSNVDQTGFTANCGRLSTSGRSGAGFSRHPSTPQPQQQQARSRHVADERPPFKRSISMPASSASSFSPMPQPHARSPDLDLRSLQGAIDEVVSNTPQLALFPVDTVAQPHFAWQGSHGATAGSQNLQSSQPRPIGSRRSEWM